MGNLVFDHPQNHTTGAFRPIGIPTYNVAASTEDSDALAFIVAASITDPTQKSAINTLVLGLKAQQLWSKLKAIYPFVGGSASPHSYNLKNPAAYQLNYTGSITHSSTGVAWDGSTGFADTGFIPSNLLTQDSEHYSYYSRSSSTANGYDIGSAHSTGQHQWSGIGLYGTKYFAYMNNGNTATATIETSVVSGAGLWLGSRRSPTNLALYNNGASIGTSTDTNIWVLANTSTYIGAHNLSGSAIQFSPRECAWASIGDGLSSTDASNLYTLVQAYQTSLSRQV